MKNSIYMLCIGLLFGHSLQPGNICCGMRDCEKKEVGLRNVALDPRHLKELYPASDENNTSFDIFTAFVQQDLDKEILEPEVIGDAHRLLTWAVDQMDVDKITTRTVYDCWSHYLGILADCLHKRKPGTYYLPPDYFHVVDMLHTYDQNLKYRLFTYSRSAHGLSDDAIVAWIHEVGQHQVPRSTDRFSPEQEVNLPHEIRDEL